MGLCRENGQENVSYYLGFRVRYPLHNPYIYIYIFTPCYIKSSSHFIFHYPNITPTLRFRVCDLSRPWQAKEFARLQAKDDAGLLAEYKRLEIPSQAPGGAVRETRARAKKVWNPSMQTSIDARGCQGTKSCKFPP